MVTDTETKHGSNCLKFLCSYGGKILPRSTDGKLRYVGGLTRVLAVERSISFSELMLKLGDFCGQSVDLRCQLPDGDLETLISIKSDEDLASIIQEYDGFSGLKIRAILSPPKPIKQMSPPSSGDLSPKSPFSGVDSPPVAKFMTPRCFSPPKDYYSGMLLRRRSYETHCCRCNILQRNPRLYNWH